MPDETDAKMILTASSLENWRKRTCYALLVVHELTNDDEEEFIHDISTDAVRSTRLLALHHKGHNNPITHILLKASLVTQYNTSYFN